MMMMTRLQYDTPVYSYIAKKREKCIFQQDDVRMSLSIVPHSKSCMKNVLFILFSVEKERWKKKLQRESNKVSGVSKRLSPVVTTRIKKGSYLNPYKSKYQIALIEIHRFWPL